MDSVLAKVVVMEKYVEPHMRADGVIRMGGYALESDISNVLEPWNLGISMKPWSRLS